MELQQVVGNRRSFRYLDPDRPVEIWKIQKMLEAARLASHFGNNNAARALVVDRATATEEQRDCLPSPVGGFQIQQAPVVILWYVETEAMDEAGQRLRELVACGALGYGPGRNDELERTLVPMFAKGAAALKAPGLVDMDLGQAIAQATLMGIELGLGMCLQGSPNWERTRKAFKLPASCRIAAAQTLGYPIESMNGGGQRPRLPFETLFQYNSYAEPFPRDPKVVAELEASGLLQAAAPLPGREEEVERIRAKYNLPRNGMI
ncbi:MAG TPA: nitroreductase family protein [Rubrivivax sp.]|nr:nitroreductase family protein [Rubrivivax sp.]HPO18093.1 nitroreductase family protein [Rubrivivax sp.]